MIEKSLKAQLILENGRRFDGRAFGYLKENMGELVFYSGSSAYQETLTDPSFAGQIVVMTYPLVGNYGINLDDNEAAKTTLRGLVVREACDKPNNWRCEMNLEGFLKQNKIIGIEGIDTRELTRVLRDCGTMKAFITIRASELTESQIKQKFETFHVKTPAYDVSCKQKYTVDGKGYNLAVLDLGLRNSIIKEFSNREFKQTVFPANSTFEEIEAEKPDGLFISCGPGNPSELTETVELIRKFLGKIPVTGIGLGHTLIANALGCKIAKLKYGHHGASYPVKDLKTGKILITSQNHNYICDSSGEGVTDTFSNINDKSSEGIEHKEKMTYSVQFHPETQDFIGNTGFFYDKVKSLIELNNLRGANKNA